MTENKIFTKIDFTQSPLEKGEYENCTFRNCNFYETNLSNIIFRECEFNACDISLARLKNTVFNDIRFINCKLLGLHFDHCSQFLLFFTFEDCSLKLSTFYKLKLKKTLFKNCNLQEVDFTETDISQSKFENCDLQRAIFAKTNLEMVDFRTAYNYSIDPEFNRMKKAKFSATGVIGLLDKYNIIIE